MMNSEYLSPNKYYEMMINNKISNKGCFPDNSLALEEQNMVEN